MKFLIILSALLLIPIVMKFQQQTFQERSVPKTAALLRNLLHEEGVIDPEVTVDYLDVTIGGLVQTSKEVRAIGKKVDGLRGVRLVANQLAAKGALAITRRKGRISASGLIPSGWREEIFKKQPQVDTSNLTVSDTVSLEGVRSVSLGLIVDEFFQVEGDRALRIQGNRLSFSGESTPSEESSLEKLVTPLGGGIELTLDLTLRPSRYHFESRELSSPIEGESRRSLSQQLANSTVEFAEGESSLTPAAHEMLTQVASVLTLTDPGVEFVIGCHPDQGGDELAEQRAIEAHQFLEKAGIRSSQLKRVTFEMTEEESGFLGQVELIVR